MIFLGMKRPLQSFCLVGYLLGFMLMGIFSPAFSQNSIENAYNSSAQPVMPGSLILKLKPEFIAAAQHTDLGVLDLMEKIVTLPSGKVQRIFPELVFEGASKQHNDRHLAGLFYVFFDQDIPVGQVLAYLSGNPAIAYIEPWYGHKTFYQPNDPLADTTSGLNRMWYLSTIQAREAWDMERGDTSVVVGVVDSGTGIDHPDLVENVAYNYDDPIDGQDNDFDGYVDNYRGWDFGGDELGGLGDNDPQIGNVHGNWVTGIIGARANNGIGLPGLCFNCEYLPIKAAPNDSIGVIFYGYQGIIYALQQGAEIVNCSWGGSVRSSFGQDVVAYATRSQGAAIIAACGNSGIDQAFFPAAYDEVISVANSYIGDTLFVNSTYHNSVDLIAPGFGIRSTLGNQGYLSWGGTSASSPVVASAVALTMAHYPELSGFQAAQRVRVTADTMEAYPANAAQRDKIGQGRVNMFRALSDPEKPSIRYESITARGIDGDKNLRPGDTIEVQLAFFNYLATAENLSITMEVPDNLAPFAEMLESSRIIGQVGSDTLFFPAEPFKLVLTENLPTDFDLSFRLSYVDSLTTYSDFEYISLETNISYLDISDNFLHTSITSRGGIGWNDFVYQEQGQGVSYQGRANALFEAGFMLGASTTQVFDRVRNRVGRDNDFRILEPLIRREGQADFEAIGRFDDTNVGTSLGLEITHEAYAFDRPGWEDFVLLSYIVHNPTASPVYNLHGGIFADWDISPYIVAGQPTRTDNACNYDSTQRMVFAYDRSGNDPTYYGFALLTDQPLRAFAFENDGSFLFSTAEKYNALSNVPTPQTASAGLSGNGGDVIQTIAGGPFFLLAGETDTVVFAMIARENYPAMLLSRDQAEQAYRCYLKGEGPLANFAFIQDSIFSVGEAIQFADQNANANSWVWDFGDGNGSVQAMPEHAFSAPGTYEVNLVVSDGTCEATHKQQIVVQNATGISSSFDWGVRVAPNPARESLRLYANIPTGKAELIMLNSLGQKVRSQAVFSTNGLDMDISVEGLAPGIYTLSVRKDGESEHVRFRKE